MRRAVPRRALKHPASKCGKPIRAGVRGASVRLSTGLSRFCALGSRGFREAPLWGNPRRLPRRHPARRGPVLGAAPPAARSAALMNRNGLPGVTKKM